MKFVYFDLGNVLLTFDNQRAYRQMAHVADIAVDALREFLQSKDYPNRLETGLVSFQEVYADFCSTFGERCSRAALEFAGSNMFDTDRSVLPLVARLAVAGVRMGILSNTCAPHWEHVTDGRFRFLNEMFECYALSYQIKAMKPAAEIYAAAADLAGVQPQDIFFTDDRPANVEGARRAGWQAVQFHSASQLAESMREAGVRFTY